MTLTERLAAKRTQVLRIAGTHGARKVRVFGSAVCGEDAAASDLDLLISLDPGRSLLDIIAIKQDLEDLLECSVDVVTEAGISPYIRDEVMREAVEL
ncbi:MAG: nucleotidyltransferase [Armatimonadetes bacterium RBG_16_58_9]|nr:MAG: nucleotidyltransferase [Armatimonadetes bacterium RBG_16_58_9]